MKGAKNIRFISRNEKDYSVNLGDKDEKTYIFQEYKVKQRGFIPCILNFL